MKINLKTIKISFKVLILASFFAVINLTNNSVLAEDFFCAQVIPACDQDGNPAKPYDNVDDPCYSFYANQCLKQQLLKVTKELKDSNKVCKKVNKRGKK